MSSWCVIKKVYDNILFFFVKFFSCGTLQDDQDARLRDFKYVIFS